MLQKELHDNPFFGGAPLPPKTLDVDAVMKELSMQEKIQLLSGVDNWHLKEIKRLGIPAIRVSDGPNGIRGTKMFNGSPAACLPCGTALAATWDMDMIRRGGELQAREAIAKGVSVILGPTINTQRSPMGGRSFESFSEDPVLAGATAAATIQGIQSKGLSTVIKHFVCNDQEHERMKQDSRVSARALREIYMLPFQIALRLSKPWAFMSSYNRVNGIHASEDPWLLGDVLRGEWGFDGLVMSDWTGTYSTAEAIKAGLDLEMPGPSLMRASLVNHALVCGKLSKDDIDICVRRVLQFINRVIPLGIPSHAPERTIDTKETAAELRSLASSSIVLLRNEEGISSLSTGRVDYTVGCASGSKPALITNMIPELRMSAYNAPSQDTSRQKLDEMTIKTSDLFFFDYCPPLPMSHHGAWYADITGTLIADVTGEYLFSISVAGTARLFVDGTLVVDAASHQTAGGTFFGHGTGEILGRINLVKSQPYKVMVEFGSIATSLLQTHSIESTTGGGIRIGCAYQLNAEEEIRNAVRIAKHVDQVAIIAGLNSDIESEGYDREEFGLPGHADRLIREVAAANPNTAVVVQSGSPVAMPWMQLAPAIVQAWYGGNETGNAIADILFGDVNPAGKLPLTFPVRLEDTPTYLNFGSERGRTLYGEDVFVGYRFYEKSNRRVLFPFGHGLSYTEFKIGKLNIYTSEKEDTITVSISVQNLGSRAGAYVAQVYISQRQPSVARPIKELKGFTKVFLESGEEKTGTISMSFKYATSFWDEQKNAWAMEKDTFDVLIGSSSYDKESLSTSFEVSENKWWSGI
ncbi:uncharacterized protein PV06_04110 [Exophiala oligosperma]|uniref:beta-glucosidase n=1 Tax=Exophiala oligosperma TaxID=215243 RepID=A0A0D2C7G2_9EURO|nr:uncharacterized protein PV06_04110 [Exophiala oligosperma]KIW45752.1 hypothetical protein PV06_04110 [Exophiala oligosperma]